jgi:hypothetical protein
LIWCVNDGQPVEAAENSMMRTPRSAGRPIYGFSLQQHVPECHLLRLIDRFVELGVLKGGDGNREH